MAKINCPKCNNNSLEVMVDVTMVIPMDAMHELSKKALRDKRVQLWAANWERSSWFCKTPDCGWQKISPNPPWLNELKELREKVKELEASLVEWKEHSTEQAKQLLKSEEGNSRILLENRRLREKVKALEDYTEGLNRELMTWLTRAKQAEAKNATLRHRAITAESELKRSGCDDVSL